jgi:hypothetical protein
MDNIMTKQPTLSTAEALRSIRQALNRQQFPAEVLLLSARQGLAPINTAIKGLNDIKAHELPDEQRREIENKRRDLVEFKNGLRAIYLEAADRSGTTGELLRAYFTK